MIKYNLKCQSDHEFESWFSDSEEFEKLKKKNLLECIFCSSKKINKSIMSPMISNLKINNEQIEINKKYFKSEKKKLLELRKYIENNFDYVGKDFSKKVREIYYDEKNKKTIYGTVTPKEKEELAEEGIDLLAVPWVNKDN
tara:strand:+ start:1315 stop:1737 length:423 start_codon:yes stop_codon:yes gene_type:complete